MGNRQQINKCNNNLNNQNYGVKIKQGKEDGEQGRMRIEDGQANNQESCTVSYAGL